MKDIQMTPEEIEDSKRSWDFYQNVQEVLGDGDYTNGDVLFVMGVIVGEMVMDGELSLEELLEEVKAVAQSTVKNSTDA